MGEETRHEGAAGRADETPTPGAEHAGAAEAGGGGPGGAAGAPGDGADSPSGFFATVLKPTLDAVVAPRNCWRALDDRPALAAWIVVWVAVLTTVIGFYNLPLTQQAWMVSARAGIEAQGEAVTEERLQEIEPDIARMATLFTGLGWIFVVVQLLIFALIVWIGASLLGGEPSFRRSFAVVAAASVIYPLLYSVYAALVLRMDPPEIRRPEDVAELQPSAGLDLLFAGVDLPAWADVLLRQAGVFHVWWIVLVASGCAALLKLSKGKGAAIAIVITALAAGAQLLARLVQPGA